MVSILDILYLDENLTKFMELSQAVAWKRSV